MGRRAFVLLLGLVLLLAGCTRNEIRGPDPLDWTIHADDGGELQQWFDEALPLMSDDLGRELAICVGNIRETTYVSTSRDPNTKPNVLARHFDGMTVRQVLIEGNELGVRLMESRVDHESKTLLAMINSANGDSPREQKYIDRQRLIVDALKKRMTEAQDHLTELHAGGLKP